MNPAWRCRHCGRFLSDRGAVRLGEGYAASWTPSGVCRVHGEVDPMGGWDECFGDWSPE